MHYFLGFELHHQSTTPYSLSTRMAPKGWTTDAQAEFLASYLPLYTAKMARDQSMIIVTSSGDVGLMPGNARLETCRHQIIE